MDIAGRGGYDSPKYCGTFLNAIPRSEKEVIRINPLLVSVNSLTLSPLTFCYTSVLSSSVFVTAMRFLLGT